MDRVGEVTVSGVSLTFGDLSWPKKRIAKAFPFIHTFIERAIAACVFRPMVMMGMHGFAPVVHV